MNKLKTSIIIATIIASALPALAQRKSPHETVSTVIGDRRTGNRITITYGRPYAKDRKIWGGLVPYDKA
jgi:hypothetical protein